MNSEVHPYTAEDIAQAFAEAGEQPLTGGEAFDLLLSDEAPEEAPSESIPDSPRLTASGQLDRRCFNRGHVEGRPEIPYKPYFKEGEHAADQPFHNSYELPPRLTNSYKTEKPAHRLMAYLRAQGMSYREIGERLGYNPITVGQVCRLPWAEALIRDEIKLQGRSAVEAILTVNAPEMVQAMVDIALDPKQQTRDRINAMKDLLDRKFGRATQPLEVSVEADPTSLSDEELMKILAQRTSN